MSEPLSFLPVRQNLNLAGNLTRTLQLQIEAGELAPGQKLPTEQAIVQSTGVSRTVVREALASLRAKGLIYTRQGLGAFVAEPPATVPSFTLTQPTSDQEILLEVLRVLELRLGIEVEAAALAAERRTVEDLVALAESLQALEAANDQQDDGAEHDFAFHRAMLVATHNPYFPEILEVFGGLISPRQKLRLGGMTASDRVRHLRNVAKEHRSIFTAIEASDAVAARKTVRAHLEKAIGFYRKLAGSAA
jgi:GntR family transcriptional repressor for pyruvate dehydrogenase complex